MPRSLLLALPILAAGCDDTIFGTPEGGGNTVTETGYAGVVALADANCMPCHSASGNSVGLGLDLETDFYAATVNVASSYDDGHVLVVPSDAQSSLLYLKMTNAQPSGTGSLMPLQGLLPAETVKVVEDWIVAGAPEE